MQKKTYNEELRKQALAKFLHQGHPYFYGTEERQFTLSWSLCYLESELPIRLPVLEFGIKGLVKWQFKLLKIENWRGIVLTTPRN